MATRKFSKLRERRAVNLPMDTGGQAQFSPPGAVLFQRSVEVPSTPEELFRFHENPENIPKIAPVSLRVESVECERTAREGGIFRIRASQFGLPIRWTGMWERVEFPRALVDTAIRSPFSFWRHSHVFEPLGEGCRMTDRVEFLLRGGWIGGVVSRLAMPIVFAAMFRARHAATVRWFSRSSPGSRSPAGG